MRKITGSVIGCGVAVCGIYAASAVITLALILSGGATWESWPQVFATGIIYAEGHSGPYCRMMPCPDCNGKKVIPAAMFEWMERGKEIRHWRRSSELTLRDAAQRAGLMPSEVSRLECGRVDNANWQELLKVE